MEPMSSYDLEVIFRRLEISPEKWEEFLSIVKAESAHEPTDMTYGPDQESPCEQR
jgi:hypothetical protein